MGIKTLPAGLASSIEYFPVIMDQIEAIHSEKTNLPRLQSNFLKDFFSLLRTQIAHCLFSQ